MQYDSICNNREFARIYKKGKCIVHKEVVVYYKKTNRQKIRVGITASKKVGNAVKRNRARRVIRHAMENVLVQCTENSYDIVFVARVRTVSLKSTQLQNSLQALFENEGLI